MELNLTRFDSSGGRLLQFLDRDEPLLRLPRLEFRMAAVAGHDRVRVVFDMVEQAQFVERFNHGFTRLVAIHAAELTVPFHHMGGLVEDVDARQVVTLAHTPVVWIVCWRDFHETRPELGIDHEVLENGNLAIDERQAHLRADELLLRGIFRRNGHAGVAEHGLGTRGGHNDVFLPVDGLDERITQMPQMTDFINVLGFIVGYGRRAMGTPVHDALSPVDELVMVPIGEHLAYRMRIIIVEREMLVVIIARAAHALDLAHDGVAIFLAPFPAFFDERIATDLQTRNTTVGKRLIHLRLRGDARMIGSEHPPRGASLHARVTCARILNGVVQSVAHMEHARDIRRRDDNRIRLIGVIAPTFAASEITRVFPRVEKRRLMRREIVVDLF